MGNDAMSFYESCYFKISKSEAKINIYMENNNEHKKDIGMCENFMIKKIAEFGQTHNKLFIIVVCVNKKKHFFIFCSWLKNFEPTCLLFYQTSLIGKY
jgi:hypothetical protein